MYYFKKLSLFKKKQNLLIQKGKLIIEKSKHSSWTFEKYDAQITAIDVEVKGIDEILDYIAKDKPKNMNKINNTSVNVGAKNESGAKIQLPPIIEK